MDIDPSTGTVFWPSPVTSETPYTITIRADNVAGYALKTWFVTVIDPPVIAPISDESIGNGVVYMGPTPILIQGTPPVTWSLVNGPMDMTIDPATGAVYWSNPDHEGSPYTITIRATNTVGSDKCSWVLTVIEPVPHVDVYDVHVSAHATRCVVTWVSEPAGSSQVQYGQTDAYGDETPMDTQAVTTHSVTITPLACETTYHYRVRSTFDGGYWAVSADSTFTTLMAGDVDGNGHVDVVDLLYFVDAFGSIPGDTNYNIDCDFNANGSVDVVDLLMLAENFGR